MLEAGKLDSELLKKIVFDKITYKRPEVIKRPGIGEDCAVVDYGEYVCVMSTDPITAAISQIGRLSIHISCNDVASNGVQPLGITLAVMLPVGTTEDEIEQMMSQAAEAAEAMEVEIIGGHTEITPAVNKPVIVSTAIGKSLGSGCGGGEDMEQGDLIMLTKWAGLEGTGVIAYDFADRLSSILTKEEIKTAQDMLDYVSVVKEGVAAGKIGTHGMHDVTEGGILGAVWELCRIGGMGAEIYQDKVPVKEITKKICDEFGIDWMRLISSGCMIIIVPEKKKEAMEEAMKKAGVDAAYIGIIKRGDIELVSGEERLSVKPPESDELYKVVGRE